MADKTNETASLRERQPVHRGGFVYRHDRGVQGGFKRSSQHLDESDRIGHSEATITPFWAGSVGDSYDNALAETITGLYKAEIIRRRGPWRSFGAVEFGTVEWVDWFTNRRLVEPIGDIPPAEAEKRRYAMLEQPATAA